MHRLDNPRREPVGGYPEGCPADAAFRKGDSMAKRKTDDKIAASESTVRKVADSMDTEAGTLYEYHGEGYMPVGAMKVRALSRLKAIQAFRESLEEFGYSDDSDAGYSDDDDDDDDNRRCACSECRRSRE